MTMSSISPNPSPGPRHQTVRDAFNKPGKTGVARLIAATGYSMQGFKATWRHEEAFRLEICACLFFIPASYWLGTDLTHKLLLVTSCVLVLLAELFNSAIEATVDRVSHENHPLSGLAKDIGSAGVFLTMMLFLLIWGSSLWQWLALR